MLPNVSPQLLRSLSAPPLLLCWTLASPPGIEARRGGLPGAATHHSNPIEGLPAHIPARLVSIDSGCHVSNRIVYVGKANNETGHLVSACLTSAERTKNRSWVRGRAKALGAAGDGIFSRETILEESLDARDGHQGLLWLARAARLSSCSSPAPSPKICGYRAIYSEADAFQAMKADEDISITFAYSLLSVV
jgi:hypothetical protein